MPALKIYRQADFPAVLKWQAIAFMRGEWPFVFTGPGKFAAETYPPEYHPVHFAAIEGDTLLSYAAVLRLELEHAGESYTSYGFGNMFTFLPYRREGYGHRVLGLATDFIRRSDVDIAVLFCDPTLEAFYAASGWETTASPTRIGVPSAYETHHVTRMMLFVSEQGKAGKADFDTYPLYIGETW